MYRRHFRHDQKQTTPQKIIIKFSEWILKASREKCQFIYKSKHLRITSDLSAQILKAKKA
jgi:hypothetical protein